MKKKLGNILIFVLIIGLTIGYGIYKEMTPLHVELYERYFSLHPDDAEKEELLKEQIYQDW